MRRRLVHEHREALAIARRLERADARTAADDRRALLLFWYGTGAARLRAEERLLLSAWERHGGADHPVNASIRPEHARLAAAIARIAGDARTPPEALRRAGRGLAALVRRQDHELVPIVECSLHEAEIADVLEGLEGLELRGAPSP
jgi:hypothetical protein